PDNLEGSLFRLAQRPMRSLHPFVASVDSLPAIWIPPLRQAQERDFREKAPPLALPSMLNGSIAAPTCVGPGSGVWPVPRSPVSLCSLAAGQGPCGPASALSRSLVDRAAATASRGGAALSLRRRTVRVFRAFRCRVTAGQGQD